jgi:hypothetical protein
LLLLVLSSNALAVDPAPLDPQTATADAKSPILWYDLQALPIEGQGFDGL